MKNILKILFLIGLSGNFLIAAKMYIVDDVNPDSFTVTAGDPPIGDAYYTVGVTIAPFDNHGTDEWELTDAKLNPVHMLDNAFFVDSNIPGGVPGLYYLAQATTLTGSTQFIYKKMVINSVAHEQYTGQPLFMLYDAWANTADDYKGDSIPTGEAALRFFPVLDMVKFTADGGAYFDYHYKIEGQTTWNECNTIKSGPNGAVSTEGEVFGDLTDHLPVETIWDAKTDLGTDFNENIVVRIRAKYGTEAFASAPTDSGSGSTPSAQFELDGNDANGMAGYSFYDPTPGGADATSYSDSMAKRDDILSTYGLTGVGSYDDGMQTYPVYDFQGMEAARDAFVPTLTGRYYAINDTSLVAVQPAGTGGAN
jgi:hypothetical protein